MVAETHNGRYTYYRCHSEGCRGRYAREEAIEAQYIELLSSLALEDHVLTYVKEALRESHDDEKRHHDEAIEGLQTRYQALQRRVDTMYIDKLEGRVDNEFFDAKGAEWREDQHGILRDLRRHQEANTDYLDEGVRLLDLADHAEELFLERDHEGRRELLAFLMSESSWSDGKLDGRFPAARPSASSSSRHSTCRLSPRT